MLVPKRGPDLRRKTKRYCRRVGRTAARTVWSRGGSTSSQDAQESPQLWNRELYRCVSGRASYCLVSGVHLVTVQKVAQAWTRYKIGPRFPLSIYIPIPPHNTNGHFFPAPLTTTFGCGMRQKPGKARLGDECNSRSSQAIMGGWSLKCVSLKPRSCTFLRMWPFSDDPSKWSIQVLGSS